MVKSPRLPEPRLAAFRPVDSRRGFAGGRTLARAPLACARGCARRFFVAVRVRLRPVSLIARPRICLLRCGCAPRLSQSRS